MASSAPLRAEGKSVPCSPDGILAKPPPARMLNMLLPLLLILAFLMPGFAIASGSEAWRKELPHTRMPKYLSDRLFSVDVKALVSNNHHSSLTARLCTLARFECDPDVMVPSLEADSGERYLGKLFSKSEVSVGNEITAPNLESDYPFRAFLPDFLAKTIPLDGRKLEEILEALDVPAHSRLANYMNLTLYDCEAWPEKECVRSVEEMVSMVVQSLGRDVEVKRTKWCKESMDNMTVVEMAVAGSHKSHKSVICTEEMFPFLIYNCYEVKHTQTLEVTMETSDGRQKVHALMQCHIPSHRQQDSDLPTMNLTPNGQERELCHWLTEKEILFVRREKEKRKRDGLLWKVVLP